MENSVTADFPWLKLETLTIKCLLRADCSISIQSKVLKKLHIKGNYAYNLKLIAPHLTSVIHFFILVFTQKA